jgi:hypothetical protein
MGSVDDQSEQPPADSAEVTTDGDHGDNGDSGESQQPPKKFNRSKRFWAIMATLCAIALLSSLENTVVTTALPFIVTQLNLGPNYIWVTNAFFLTAFVPELLLQSLPSSPLTLSPAPPSSLSSGSWPTSSAEDGLPCLSCCSSPSAAPSPAGPTTPPR